VYNEELADKILEALDVLFPTKVGLAELKNARPEFSNVPEADWLMAIDALEKDGLVDGLFQRAGFNKVLQGVARLVITPSGRDRILERQQAMDRSSRLEKLGDRLFERIDKQLYDDVNKVARDLAEKYSVQGLARSSAFAREAVGIALSRLERLQEAFASSYIHLVSEKEGEISEAWEKRLQEKVGKILERELPRARKIASYLCQITGLTDRDVAPQVQEVDRKVQDLKQAMLGEIEIAVLSKSVGFGEGASAMGAHGEDVEAVNRGQRTAPVDKERSRRVFVIHGRDERLRRGMFEFLRSIGLEPLEWTKAIALTGKASPYIGEILKAAFNHALAVVALFSPDDEARLRGEFLKDDDPPYERELTGQARANVLFESGMALASHEDQTVLLQFGKARPFTDVGGRHVVMMDNSVAKRQELAMKLKTAGCTVDLDGTDWHTAGDLTPPQLSLEQAPETSDGRPATDESDMTVKIARQVESDLAKLEESEKEALRQLLIKGELTDQTAIQAVREKGLLRGEVGHIFYRIESITGFVERSGPYYESDHVVGYRGRWRISPSLKPILEAHLFPKE